MINNNAGESLLEVMIAMLILTFAFLGVMALSISLLDNNSLAGKTNFATNIAQMEVSQLNCLGVTNVTRDFGVPSTYSYTVSPVILTPDTRNTIKACINPALAVGGPQPAGLLSAGGIGITNTYLVTITLAENPNPNTTGAVDATVDVSWDSGHHVIVMDDIIA